MLGYHRHVKPGATHVVHHSFSWCWKIGDVYSDWIIWFYSGLWKNKPVLKSFTDWTNSKTAFKHVVLLDWKSPDCGRCRQFNITNFCKLVKYIKTLCEMQRCHWVSEQMFLTFWKLDLFRAQSVLRCVWDTADRCLNQTGAFGPGCLWQIQTVSHYWAGI